MIVRSIAIANIDSVAGIYTEFLECVLKNLWIRLSHTYLNGCKHVGEVMCNAHLGKVSRVPKKSKMRSLTIGAVSPPALSQ
ncbi:hypothetical protein LBMAG21_16850 [Armatimonadota bacterium]|nr:hypothetical protein LBMAG21_16850 [Armatimonadota bacterium]